MDFKPFDTRGYPVLTVAEGYAEWAASYDEIVLDEMDIRLLERVTSVVWPDTGNAVDLACGTGRIGAWLRERWVGQIEGVDLSNEMLERARVKNVFAVLHKADVRRTGLAAGGFRLVTMVLAECHLEDLRPFYAEAARLLAADGALVLVGYHPHFLLKGVPTHFDRANGQPVAIENHIHLFSDHAKAAFAAGYELVEMHEGLIDDA